MPKWEPFAQVKLTAGPEPEPPTAIPLPATQNEIAAPAPPPPPNSAPVAEPVQSSSSEDSAGVICAACGERFPLMDTARFGDRYVCQPCRPAYVEKAWDEQEDKESGDGHVRETNLKYERRIRTAAAMYYFVSGLFVFVALGAAVNGNLGGWYFLRGARSISVAATRKVGGRNRFGDRPVNVSDRYGDSRDRAVPGLLQRGSEGDFG